MGYRSIVLYAFFLVETHVVKEIFFAEGTWNWRIIFILATTCENTIWFVYYYSAIFMSPYQISNMFHWNPEMALYFLAYGNVRRRGFPHAFSV